MGSIPGPGISHMPPGQLIPCATTTESTSSGACTLHLERSPSTTTKIPHATMKTRCSQINNFFVKRRWKQRGRKMRVADSGPPEAWRYKTETTEVQPHSFTILYYFFCFPTGPNQFYIVHTAQILGKIWRHNLTYNISNTLTSLKETATGCFSGKPVSSTSWTSQPICRAHTVEHGILSACEVYKETLH